MFVCFCFRTYRMVYNIWAWLVEGLGTSAYVGGEAVLANRRVEMYSSTTDETSKDRILEDFSSQNGNIEVLICTVSFGLGINIKDVSVVVHWGAPKNCLGYWQEIGRAGRDGRPASAILYPYPRSLLPRVCDKEFAESIRTPTDCIRRRRLYELKTDDMDMTSLRNGLPCDGVCESVCVCDLCKCCSFCYAKCECVSKRNNLF